ncbi:MAG TPA: sarcosine oxidase subunit delta [Steroidobacteraceae bacterium]|nr:sarcosine oxidase subunit delta [Steroidobacteraceae bacterium]
MLRIHCPWCGARDEIEFRYRGDAAVRRPAADAGQEAFVSYVYQRENPLGWHLEWWLHAGGCRRLLKVLRHTVTHEIRWVRTAEEGQESADSAGPA